MIRLFIADDHSVVRVGLKQLFALIDDISVAGEACDGLEVLDILQQRNDFDLLLLDLFMPGLSGFELIARIRTQNKSLPILVFSMHNEAHVAKRVFQMGANGFISKGGSEEMLIGAIRKVVAGDRFVDPTLLEQMIFEKPVGPLHESLTERELHILKLFARGKTGNEIAAELSISKKTVSTHKTNLMQKMNFENIADLVLYAADYALID
jgi:DNA-binding NarL/FixJ family response regulator